MNFQVRCFKMDLINYETFLGVDTFHALQFKYIQGLFVSPAQLVLQTYIMMQGFHNSSGKLIVNFF